MTFGHVLGGVAAFAAACSASLAFVNRDPPRSVAAATALMGAGVAAAPAAADQFAVDPVHSSVIFRIEHMGVCPFYGAFKDIGGTFALGEDPASAKFDLAIQVASIDSRNGARDKHLLSADFFDAEQHKEITFTSASAEKTAEGLKLAGDMTMHGVTRPVTAQLKVWPLKDTPQGARAGFEAIFTIKRSDFGMTYGIENGSLGDEVAIIVACEGKKQ